MDKGIVVDHVFQEKFQKGIVLVHDNIVYSAHLNQTNVKLNSNKFYITQIIHCGNEYNLCARYGRIGEVGTTLIKCCKQPTDAIREFNATYKKKTGNTFGGEFIKKEGKYNLAQVVYDEVKNIKLEKIPEAESKLESKVQDLIKLLTNDKFISNTLVSLEIDLKKMPLGKINDTQLLKAGDILEKLKGAIEKNDTHEISDLSSQYYTLVPMVFGRKNIPSISSLEIVQNYQDRLQELKNVAVIVKIVKPQIGVNPIDNVYNEMGANIRYISDDDDIYKMFNKYIINTHGPTHGCKLSLREVYSVAQAGKEPLYNEFTKTLGNKMLLFHGSPLCNWVSIIKNDLVVNPQLLNKNIAITGKMFGNGIYFADSSKSFGYTRASQTNDIGIYAVAEVALGDIYQLNDANYYLDYDTMKKIKKDSTKGNGMYQTKEVELLGDVQVPNGKLQKVSNKNCLRYNEYIVYNNAQFIIRYLLVIKNDGNYTGM